MLSSYTFFAIRSEALNNRKIEEALNRPLALSLSLALDDFGPTKELR